MVRKSSKGKKKVHVDIFRDQTFETELLTCDRSPIFGRFLKAKSDIQKGTKILNEKCLIAGPKIFDKNAACIGCYSYLNSIHLKCTNCSWPLCNERCEQSKYHSELDCSFFVERKIKPPDSLKSIEYGAIAVLRTLLLKICRPKDWEKLLSLEHHNDDRKNLPLWNEDIVAEQIIREQWNLGDLFTADEIHTVCGIYEVNGFEMGAFNTIASIFPFCSLITHSCIPNSGHFENVSDETLEVVSLVNIDKNAPITMCYDWCLKGTDVRRRYLLKSKYFYCSCARCNDPFECNTNFSTILCNNPDCKNGSVVSTKCVGLANIDADWKCRKCSKIFKVTNVRAIVEKYEKIGETLGTVKDKENFLLKCKSIFHPSHFIPFAIKFSLCMAYGHDAGYTLHEMSQSDAHRKMELCQEVLKILDILSPGNILYELQAAEVLLSRNILESGRCPKTLMRKRLQNSLEKLDEAIIIFELSYPMRMLAESAKMSTRLELIHFIKALK
ncbi:SET domain-containing protein SmydA-8, isoform B [Pseudolycoriella hygida]|uniref:SET domain-containing protein SmydA-8, isoform B n=1 Tax=Pseudolycoriella hygida TaxID=35572 RepID=A0A9Q0N6R0_9DIPT|nr:SET domain-containing protein SmydA-8, isoform B [Pseudolycoriella hygida]